MGAWWSGLVLGLCACVSSLVVRPFWVSGGWDWAGSTRPHGANCDFRFRAGLEGKAGPIGPIRATERATRPAGRGQKYSAAVLTSIAAVCNFQGATALEAGKAPRAMRDPLLLVRILANSNNA